VVAGAGAAFGAGAYTYRTLGADFVGACCVYTCRMIRRMITFCTACGWVWATAGFG
jgi:hypothetical protein